ncbi:hypothetical protein KFE25_010674 [Diacronema lutheri]|uniref:Uncharacterized protein n=1 Tax=Diacronema lutheri TaxID=2081491 RepID=A0A8J5X772_DIALT|nr:hypothetical protein KFE25_010674 [Diacronema lutheri]
MPKLDRSVLRSLAYSKAQADGYASFDGQTDETDDVNNDEQERSVTLFPIALVYVDIATDNLLTKANVEKMRTVEWSIMAVDIHQPDDKALGENLVDIDFNADMQCTFA